MNIELYFAPGACSFVPHVALEAVRAATGQSFEPKLVKLHKGEHRTPEYLAMNPNGQVPLLVAEGKPLTQIVAICEYLDRSFPQAEVKKLAAAKYRKLLERIQGWTAAANPYWFGERVTCHDAYAFTLLRWGGIAGIDPQSLPSYLAYAQRAMAAAPLIAALERERIKLDTYKAT